MAQTTLNGKYAAQIQKDADRDAEIAQFISREFRSFGWAARTHISTANGTRNTSKPQDAGNGSLRFN